MIESIVNPRNASTTSTRDDWEEVVRVIEVIFLNGKNIQKICSCRQKKNAKKIPCRAGFFPKGDLDLFQFFHKQFQFCIDIGQYNAETLICCFRNIFCVERYILHVFFVCARGSSVFIIVSEPSIRL